MSKYYQSNTCCWSANCCLLKCLSQCIRDKEVLGTHISHNMQEESVQMLDMSNLRRVPNQNQIENVSLNQSRTVILPSAANMSVDTTVSSAPNMSHDVNMQPTV
jgi:hypothetical protein